MRAELGQGWLGGAATATLLRLGEDRAGLFQGDREELVLRREAPAVGVLLDVRPVTAVLCGDLLAVVLDADDPRERQQVQRVFQGHRRRIHGGEERRTLRLLLRARRYFTQLDERPEASGDHEHGQPGLGIVPELTRPRRDGEQLLGLLGGELVGREIRRDRTLLVAAFDVGAVRPDPHDELAPFGVDTHVHRVDLGLVDLGDVLLGDQIAQTHLAVAEVEGVQPLFGFTLAARDRVERFFHHRGELVVDEVAEVALEQLHLGEGRPRGNERASLLEDVVAPEDRLDDRRVRRRATDAAFLELLDQAGLGVARRRLRRVP